MILQNVYELIDSLKQYEYLDFSNASILVRHCKTKPLLVPIQSLSCDIYLQMLREGKVLSFTYFYKWFPVGSEYTFLRIYSNGHTWKIILRFNFFS